MSQTTNSTNDAYGIAKGIPLVRFEQADKQMDFLPYAQLLHLHLSPSDGTTETSLDVLRMMFSTHDVRVSGYRLEVLARAFQKAEVEWVRATPGRFAALNPDHPVVTEISVVERAD